MGWPVPRRRPRRLRPTRRPRRPSGRRTRTSPAAQPDGCAAGTHNDLLGLITQIGRAPGVRRLVRKRPGDGVVTESPDPEDRDPRWCASCGREVLLGTATCLACGGEPLTSAELARRRGDLPAPPGAGPSSWPL